MATRTRPLFLLASVVWLFVMVGCAVKHEYGDSTSAETLTTDFSSSDLQQIATKMVESLLVFPPIEAITTTRRPVIVVDHVKNKTMQHIDTESITDSIRTKLIRTGKFRFIDRTTDSSAISEIRTQQESGLVKNSAAVPFGQQIGAEYMLTSSISEIAESSGRTKAVYYKFTMSLKNLTTGVLEWADEKEIRKIRTGAALGF